MVGKKWYHFFRFKVNEDKIFSLIQLRSLELNQAAVLVISSKATWWNVNPIGVVTTSFKYKWMKLLSSNVQFVAFIDGSFEVDKIKGCL